MAWDSNFDIPPWMNPRETPFDTLVKGAQAGSMISRAMNERTELGMQIEKQQATLPLQVQEAGLRSEMQAVNLAEQQIGLEAMQQEVEYQKLDLSPFAQYVKTLAQTTDPTERAAIPVPAFMSAATNAKAEKINKNMQDTQAVKDNLDSKKNYALSMANWERQIYDEAAKVQPFLGPDDAPIITIEQKTGKPIVNQVMLSKGRAAMTQAEIDKKTALAKEGEIKPYDVNGKTLFYYSNNPTTGAVQFHRTPTEPADKALDMELTSLYRQANHAQQSLDNIRSGQTKIEKPSDKSQAITDLTRTLNLTNDKIREAVKRRGATQSAPSKAQAVDRITVKDGAGKLFTVPKNQLEEARKKGYQPVE